MRNFELSSEINSHDPEYGTSIRALIARLELMDQLSLEVGSDQLATATVLHDANGCLIWINAKARKLLGISSQYQPNSLIEHVHVQDRVLVAQLLANGSQLDMNSNVCEFRPSSQNADLVTSWIEMSKSQIGGDTHENDVVLLTLRDITKAKQADLEAAALRDKAEEASTAKSQFLANISHELRTPLNAILGFSELLNSPIMAPVSREKQGEYVGLIHDSASHLLNVLNGILDMSKIDNGMYEIFPEAFDLAKCLTSTTAIMRGQAALKSVQVNTFGLENLPEIIADERAVKQVLINLLSNAIKFSDDHGRVTVNCERRARSVVFSVSDNGIGISPEHLGDLGKPFFQADSKYDRQYEGTGLGLSVVKGLIELHNGTLKFESQRGFGTTATVTLPIFGQKGRQVPASSEVEKITKIHSDHKRDEQVPRILRNTA